MATLSDSAGSLNGPIRINGDFCPTMTLRNPPVPPALLGDPIDLSGYSAVWQVRDSENSAGTLIAASSTNGKLILGGVAGTVTWNVVPGDWVEGLKSGEKVHDFVLISPSGRKTVILAGSITIIKGVTR